MRAEKEIALLESLGFEEFDRDKERHYDAEITVYEGERLFIYPDGSRQSLYVKLSESIHEDVWYNVYVLNDIGCGSVELPFKWSFLSEEWLTYIKMAFELKGFNKTGR